jgi:hypothetical protein
MTPETLAWTVLLLPLAAAASITVFTRRNAALSASLSVGAVALAFVASLLLPGSFGRLGIPSGEIVLASVPWLNAGGLSVDLGLRLDP